MEVPFSVQWIQTDRDSQFFAEKVRRRLMDEANRFRPIPLRWPHVTGTVERAHRRVTDEFRAVADPKAAGVVRTTHPRVHHYNWHRLHESLHGNAPLDRVLAPLARDNTRLPMRAVLDGDRGRMLATIDEALPRRYPAKSRTAPLGAVRFVVRLRVVSASGGEPVRRPPGRSPAAPGLQVPESEQVVSEAVAERPGRNCFWTQPSRS